MTTTTYFDGDGFGWTFEDAVGKIIEGRDASADPFDAFFLGIPGFSDDDGVPDTNTFVPAKLVVSDTINFSGTLIDVERRIEVPPPVTGSWARFYDSFTNNSGSAVTITVVYESNLGSDNQTAVLRAGADTTYTAADRFIITDDSPDGASNNSGGADPVITLVHGDVDAVSLTPGFGSVYTQSHVFTLAAGETASILQFATQTTSSATALTEALADASRLTTPDEGALEGLTVAERERITNFTITRPDLIDGEGFVWDVLDTGAIDEGTSDAFDNFL